MALPRVLILYTGGTFGMEPGKSRKGDSQALVVPDLSADALKKRLFQRVPELKQLAQCEVEVLLNCDSAHVGPDEWFLIASQIQKRWKKFDGVVLLHGTDTLAYTASALSFLLRPCLKPIVITGAQRPLSALPTDARGNLVSAVEIAARGPRKLVNQVTVFFGEKLFQGNRVRKKSSSDFAAFESPKHFPLATVGTSIRYTDRILRLPKPIKKNNLAPSFNRKIVIFHVTPAFPAEQIKDFILPHVEALILVVFPSGTAPTHTPAFTKLIEGARKRSIPVVVVTEGNITPPNVMAPTVQYAAGKDLFSKGSFSAGMMTLECAFVKTSFILGQTSDLKKFTQLWNKDFAGECGPH